MSSDNAIGILKTKRSFKEVEGIQYKDSDDGYTVYRVAHIFSPEMIDWFKENQEYNLGAVFYDYWKDSRVFYNEEEAINFAFMLEKSIDILEYGIMEFDFSDKFFYGDY